MLVYRPLSLSPVGSLRGPCENALFRVDVKLPATSSPFLWVGIAVMQDSEPAGCMAHAPKTCWDGNCFAAQGGLAERPDLYTL